MESLLKSLLLRDLHDRRERADGRSDDPEEPDEYPDEGNEIVVSGLGIRFSRQCIFRGGLRDGQRAGRRDDRQEKTEYEQTDA